jgi:hypothetical protein
VIVAAPTTWPAWPAWPAWRGDARTDAVAFVSGVLLAGCILVELAFMREFSFLHPTYLVVGVILMWLGGRGPRKLALRPRHHRKW